MNLAERIARLHARVGRAVFAVLIAVCAGCGPRLSTPEQLASFIEAGQKRTISVSEFIKAQTQPGPYSVVPGDVLEVRLQPAGSGSGTPGSGAAPAVATSAGPSKTSRPAPTPIATPRGPYRVVPGDVLTIRMPLVLRAVASSPGQANESYVCRVGEDGTIQLPVVGKLPAAGSALAEVDDAIARAYSPKHIRTRPSVIAKVMEYRTYSVTVSGAVASPGTFRLRADEMSLVSALTQARGIVKEGASAVRIHRPGSTHPLLIPVLGLDVPSANITLKDGDIVEAVPGLLAAGRYQYRVTDTGTIQLPVVGHVQVAGKTLAEIEGLVAKAYYPKYLASRPSVVTKVAEHRLATVSVMGGVKSPGKYELRSNELSLYHLLMKSGGVVADGASVVRVHRAGSKGDAPIKVPVMASDIPLADLALKDGDTVEVERRGPQLFTVTGPVIRRGAYRYPPDAKYTLQQALAFAGGVDPTADPRYVSVYRRAADGEIVSAALRLRGSGAANVNKIAILPGDIIVAENTLRTSLRSFFGRVFRLGVSATYTPVN